MDKMSKALMVSRKTKLPGDLVAQYRAPAFVVDRKELCRLEKKLRGLTLPERFMTQLVSIVALTRVMRDALDLTVSLLILLRATILLLPRSIEDVASFRVVLVGEFTPSQSSKLRKMHRIRNLKVRDMFKFYRENNHLYADVVPNESMLNPEF
ncbi:hypothetical protein GQ600_14432 [Phytophthora cactorum]|nr:hypothetical protein GQ600_14432 [Phytophthora cactorum]